MKITENSVSSPLLVAWLLALLYTLASIFLVLPMAPTQTEYTYDVKMEQAYNVDRVEDTDVMELSEFSKSEQDVLYKAFKEIETGQLIGETSAEVSVTFDKQRDVFDTWNTVEVNGIILLVAVQENTTQILDTSAQWISIWRKGLIISGMYSIIGLILIIEEDYRNS